MDPRGEDKEPTTRGPGGSDGRWRPLALLGLALLGLALLGLALLGLFGPRTWRPAGCDPPKASPSAFPAPHATSLPRTAVLRGLVLGLQGAPVADAEIQIRPWQLPGPDWWRRAAAIRHTAADDARWTARTGPGGYFQVALPRGRYDVQAGAPGLAWQLAAGQLSGGPLLILELEQGFAIEGILQRFSAAAQVEAEPLVAWETRPTVTARPAPDGSFLLPGLGLGAYRVSAVEETGEIASRAPVAAGTRGLSLTLLAQRGLTGVVLHASHARPVAGALVTVAGSGIWPPRTVRSDPEGRFSFPRLPVGWYALRAVREPDLASGFLEGVQVTASRAETEQGIVVEPHPRITLEVFRGDDGRPVPGAQLLLAPFLPATLAVRVATDASGQARLGPLPPGRYQLSLRAAGLAPLLEQPLEVTPLEEAGPEQSLRVTLQPAAALAGKVVDQAGAPIAGAELEVVGSDGAVGPLPRGADGLIRDRLRRRLGAEGRGGEETVGRSDATGGFRLTPLPPGTWHLVCRHAGHRPALLGPFKLLPGQRQEGIEVRLLLAGLLGGQVVDVEGDPVPFARVRFEVQAGTVTDDRGRFLLEGVWGNGHLLVQAEGYADRRQP
ncbi:MAG: carboxypeptidase-like regulatory domain-containing protein, partial [Myxococcota bacterium]|nr:carboxypeptidase-like regulatory domain-containing protein [Myxococcota bacterium]